VQLVCAGGDSDTQASAASVYEAVLLGANGGHDARRAIVMARDRGRAGRRRRGPGGSGAGGRRPDRLREMALCTLTCWQHSILEFLSCMGIDDIQKTSGNTMAITITEDWVRETDELASEEFGRLNAAHNAARVAAEPVPAEVSEKYHVSALVRSRHTDLPLVNAARVLAQRSASFHLDNSNRALNADFLEVIYRMAAGEMPELDDFFVAGDQVRTRSTASGCGCRASRSPGRWRVCARTPRCSTTSSLPFRAASRARAPFRRVPSPACTPLRRAQPWRASRRTPAAASR